MDALIKAVAQQIAEELNGLIDIPFVSEEDEKLFFQVLVTKVIDLTINRVIDMLD